MRKNVLVFGLISGLISTVWMLGFIMIVGTDPDIEHGELYGYGAMIVAFSFIVVGVKNYRDKHLGGYISFGKAFKLGFLITLTASTLYVVSWLVYYYTSDTNFIEVYIQCLNKQLVESGAGAAEIAKQAEDMKRFAEWYKNPFFNAAVTYSEILPLGTVVALITALVLKRRQRPEDTRTNDQTSIH